MAAKRRRKAAPTKPPQLRLGGFLTDAVPFRRSTRKGSEIARHMVPLGRVPGVEEELGAMVETWIAACDREVGDGRGDDEEEATG